VDTGRHRLRKASSYRDVRVEPGPVADIWAAQVGAAQDRGGRWRLRRIP
jgi:hypothetical protein